MSIGGVFGMADATQLAEWVAKGDASPGELLDEALGRAEAVNPKLNALTMLQPDAARRRVEAGLPDGPLKGVPFLLKDLGAEAADFPSNNGSALLAGTRFPGDSALVERLLSAGLVVFGRTTSPEGGIGPVTEAAVYGGPTRNPWNLDCTSGGSSGGAAAAVAAGIVPAAHGSDGGGSVRIPASSCGLFGFKATRARLPAGPYAGEGWAGMSIDGFLTRTVRDAALLLDVVNGPDLGAPYHAPALEGTFAAAAGRGPGRLRIAYTTRTFAGDALHPECAKAIENTARLLSGLGHHVEEASLAETDHAGMMGAWTTIVACGTALWVRKALRAKGRELQDGDVEAVAASACRHAASVGGPDYLDAVSKIHRYGRELARFFADCDALVTTTLAEPPAKVGRFAPHKFDDFIEYRMGRSGVFSYSPFTVCFNASGQPAASLPLHWTGDGLPVGVHIAAPFGRDELLMSLCAQLEATELWEVRTPRAELSA